MKVLDLSCENRHAFEGWFGSEEDFQTQLARGLIECPICAATAITKLLSAPRLNLGAAPDTKGSEAPAAAAAVAAAVQHDPALPAAWFAAMRRLVADTEDVGRGFAEEARRIHYGEAAQRNIRGQASPQDTEELLDEGIAVFPLPAAFGPTEH